jgi:glucosamine--fructose-6-phosphate aminotransferase (isomerizing)
MTSAAGPARHPLATPTPTRMFAEAAAAPAAMRRQLDLNADIMRRLGERLRASPPRAVVTVGRGSSDNAATFARYLVETRLEILTASAPPSVSSVYAASPAMAETLCLVISQSGHSPDLLATARSAAAAGALVVAMVNDAASPLAQMADVVIPLHAGPELSVAATKSFIGALTAIVQLIGHWTQDAVLLAALDSLPTLLERAWDLDWTSCLPILEPARHLYVVGRGPGVAVAQEAALKFKETCGLHAEAFSAAEVQHGPMALIGPCFPVLAFVPDDESRGGVETAIQTFRAQGAAVIAIGGNGAGDLPVIDCHPMLTPIVQVQSFYRMVDGLAARRGFNPDQPPHLAKVTRTL